jgi:hypothetical protein
LFLIVGRETEGTHNMSFQEATNQGIVAGCSPFLSALQKKLEVKEKKGKTGAMYLRFRTLSNLARILSIIPGTLVLWGRLDHR